MATLSGPQATEFFHVAFLDVLSRRLESDRYALKGGANLRYFFGSVRYSQDIDLDVEGVPAWRLNEKIEALLSSPQLAILLRGNQLEMVERSNPKRTDTTQRWKIGLTASGHAELIRTKVEFSYRGAGGARRIEPVPRRIVEPYALRSPLVPHYVEDAPTEQKVLALAGRSETQARDVFDLDLLLRRSPLASGALDSRVLAVAVERAMQLPYAAFHDQVLPFLEVGAVELYEGEAAWEQMQAFVAERLEEAR
ncbi:MAG TPA: nucleotidyl transferase AbiEii/AbiGii toxin family protein [Solirubrobacterales bacterium]|nr:nucleotidyl transferase AbiEii/AbiGii toxin family protein [Solirubrobacterales bacterium]